MKVWLKQVKDHLTEKLVRDRGRRALSVVWADDMIQRRSRWLEVPRRTRLRANKCKSLIEERDFV